jgi:soluble lytic murein transglycosylase-like protein
MRLDDVSAVEHRIAELSGERRSIAPQPTTGSVAAFASLLASAPPSSRSSGAAVLPCADVEHLVASACAANGADPALVKAIVANESGFEPAATSSAGAQGLMQLMPATAAELGVRDAYDPAQNIAGGTRYLGQLLQRFGGDVPAAVAAYNAGPEAIERGEIPAETQRYVRSVLDSYASYRAAAKR